MKTIRAILNGKKAGDPELRREIVSQRDNGISIEVRVTWESDDMLRLIKEAVSDGVQRIIVAGGDGTVNEAVAGLNVIESHIRPELAIIPMGTANDFATATLIPTTIKGSLELAINGESKLVDSVKANDRYFMNIAAAGFGAEITAETPVELKNFLGGGAYTLTGLAKALGFKPYNGSLTIEKGSYSGDVLVGAFCNGRLAGGGQPLAPNALIDDGLMDLTLIRPFPPYALPQVLEELKAFSETGEYIVHTRSNWLEIDFPQTLPLNLDGEPYKTNKVRFDVLHKSIKLVLPKLCPCLSISE